MFNNLFKIHMYSVLETAIYGMIHDNIVLSADCYD